MNKNSTGLWIGALLSVAIDLGLGVAASKQLAKAATAPTPTAQATQLNETEAGGRVVRFTHNAVWLQLERGLIASGPSRERPKPREDGGTPPPKM